MNDTKKTVQDVKQEAAKAVETAKQEAAKAVSEVKPAVEKAKAGAKKTVKRARKNAAKAPAKAKAAVEKAARKAVTGEAAPVVYVQYQGAEEKVEDLIAAAKAAFSAEHSRTKVADLKLYIKPEERAAYYVINEKFAGRVDF